MILSTVFFAIALLIGIVGYGFMKENSRFQNLTYPNVYINNIPVGSLSKSGIEQIFEQKNKILSSILFTIIYQNTPVATFSGSQISVLYDAKGIADRAYLIGRSTDFFSRWYQKVATIYRLQNFNLNVNVDYDNSALNDFITYSEDKYNKPAKNALFQFKNGKVVTFRPDEKGLEIQTPKLIQDFDTAVYSLVQKPENKQITLTDKTIDPEITLARSNSYGIEQLISEGDSTFYDSIPGRIHNIILASSKFNGILIPKGETLSFNNTVGDISSLTGYQQAYIIKDGKTVLGDGGGVCQVSTTLFRAALNAGLPIVERYAHAYRVGYYEQDSKPGFDATVFAPYVDLKIKNDTQAAILVQTEVDENNMSLKFKFYGKKDNRQIDISPVTVYDIQPPPPPLYQDDPTMKRGQVKQTDFSAWGSKVYFYYTVTKQGQSPVKTRFFSAYQPWQAVYLRGTAD